MRNKTRSTIGTTVAIAGIVGASLVAGDATAETQYVTLTAADRGNCQAEFTLTNHTNVANFTPDWWFKSEGPAPTTLENLKAPWREVNGIPWPIARWVGSPPSLRSEVAAGIEVWKSGVAYKANAQPDGYVSTRTINLKDVTNPAPPKPVNNTQTIVYRLRTGPVSQNFIEPKEVTVTGCKSGNGGHGGHGSLDFGSLGHGSLGHFDRH